MDERYALAKPASVTPCDAAEFVKEPKERNHPRDALAGIIPSSIL
jgi:hypothetical protein